MRRRACGDGGIGGIIGGGGAPSSSCSCRDFCITDAIFWSLAAPTASGEMRPAVATGATDSRAETRRRPVWRGAAVVVGGNLPSG